MKILRLSTALALSAAALLVVSCRPQLVVRLETVVYHDGSLTRILEVHGRTADGERPEAPDWLSGSAGVDLADSEAWGRVELGPDHLRAEGFFLDVDALPELLALRSGSARRAGVSNARLDIDHRVVARRWIFSESHGDPYGPADRAAALDGLVDLIVEALRAEILRQFGDDLDPAPAERLLRGELRNLAAALLAVSSTTPGWELAEQRAAGWSRVLSQAGLPLQPVEEPLAFWDRQFPALTDWARERVAASLSTERRPIAGQDLAFWPSGETFDDQLAQLVDRVWGGEDELTERLEPLIGAVAGYYGGDAVPRFRFEARVRLPGTLLRTNGTPDDDSVVWLFRESALNRGQVILRVESIELEAEALTSLGARKELDRIELVQLADLLWDQDPAGRLSALLEEAVRLGQLDLLRDEDEVPAELHTTAAELADLLAPPGE